MANPHPFIIPILWVCILCFCDVLLCICIVELVFIELVLWHCTKYELHCHLYCSMLFNECICAFICYNTKEKKYIYKYIY